MSQAKILTLVTSDTESSSFYRGLGPLYRLSNRYPNEFEIIKKREFNWSDFIEPHIAFLLRPSAPQHTYLISRLKGFGVKVVIDWDDDLFAVPEAHPDFEQLSSDMTRNSVVNCAQLADEIWVTTERLREVFAQFTDAQKIFVVPNAIDDKLYPEPTAPRAGDGMPVVGWRGSRTHVDDLIHGGPFFKAATEAGTRFCFIGHKPAYEMAQVGVQRKAWTSLPIEDIDIFFQTLKRLNLPFHYVPLEQSNFNLAKSNIAYLEAAWIGGSLPLVSSLWEKLPGSLVMDGPVDSDVDTRDFNLMTEADRVFHVRAAQRHIRENYLLSYVNEQRRERFKALRG